MGGSECGYELIHEAVGVATAKRSGAFGGGGRGRGLAPGSRERRNGPRLLAPTGRQERLKAVVRSNLGTPGAAATTDTTTTVGGSGTHVSF